MHSAVADAGSDHRLGAQEAFPALISLFIWVGFEARVDPIITGGPLLDYKSGKGEADPRTAAAMQVTREVKGHNHTSPFLFRGNRFEFRAVGSTELCVGNHGLQHIYGFWHDSSVGFA